MLGRVVLPRLHHTALCAPLLLPMSPLLPTPPPPSQAEHKIQSREGQLTLDLQQVPKALGVLTSTWAPKAIVVSFKLETDEDILVHKVCACVHIYIVTCNWLMFPWLSQLVRDESVAVYAPPCFLSLLLSHIHSYTHIPPNTPVGKSVTPVVQDARSHSQSAPYPQGQGASHCQAPRPRGCCGAGYCAQCRGGIHREAACGACCCTAHRIVVTGRVCVAVYTW